MWKTAIWCFWIRRIGKALIPKSSSSLDDVKRWLREKTGKCMGCRLVLAHIV